MAPTKQLSIIPMFDFSTVSYNKASDVYLDVLLSAPEMDEATKHIPLHLILAIDCSGSMAGYKLDMVKQTVEKLIRHLAEDDNLGIIGFSDNIWDVLPPMAMNQKNKELAVSNVKALTSHNMTNLSGAIQSATEKAVTGDKSKISRIIVLTDGLPTVGECNKEKLVELAGKINPTVSISTFGYGTDFDSELMTSISKVGRGNNSYIKTDEDCPKAFALELGGLLSLFAQNLRLRITPSETMSFQELLSEYKCSQKNGYRLATEPTIDIVIDDIYGGENKHILMKLTVPEATKAVCARDTRVCDLELAYSTPGTKEEILLSATAKIKYCKPEKSQKLPNEEVQKQVHLFEIAKIQKEAMEKAEKGQLQEARILLKEGINYIHLNGISGYQGYENLEKTWTTMSADFADSGTYLTRGVKSAGAVYSSLAFNRASSSDVGSMGFATKLQKTLVNSFTSDPIDPLPAVNPDPFVKSFSNPDPLVKQFVNPDSEPTVNKEK